MKFILLYILLITVYGRNSRNVEFNELPEEKISDAFCRSFHKKTKPDVMSCNIASCEWPNENLTDFRRSLSNLTLPKLVCIEDDSIHVSWEDEDDYVYFLENTEEKSINFTNVTICSHYTLSNLTQDTVYKVRLWAASFSKKQIMHSSVVSIKTPSKNLIPSPVTHIYLQNITCEESSCDAIVEWSANLDYSCEYDLVWPKEGSINEDRINVISGGHQAKLRELKFDTNYSVDIIARNGDSLHESQKHTIHFLTPTCLKIHQSLRICRPEAPQHLVINETLIDSSEEILKYDVHLSWQEPDLKPQYYTAHFVNLINENRSEKVLNITGNETKATFVRVQLGDLYHISLMACSSAGCSDKVADERHRTDLIAIDVSSHNKQLMVVTFVLVPLITVLLGVIIINYYRRRQKQKEERDKYFTGLDEEKLPECTDNNLEINLIKQDIRDQWELDPCKVCFQSIIGEGAFGIVRRAYLETKNHTKIQVAIKMLKESPSSDEIRQFTQEINIMKSVRQHPYIVSLIGCITEGRVEGPLLVVEYCSRGDLQTYLRNAWDKFCSIQQEIINLDKSLNNQKNYFANKTYEFHNINLGDEFITHPKHLLSVARQVALGMEHLAKTRVVHRDLAARNVLVCENHTVKVSDFGLSRDVYRDNVYCKSGGGKLPIRWMALESLTHQRYTTYSDVWSFGILLWEIVTLGGTPYVGVNSSDLLEFLRNGNRLSCPSNCSPELYTIMQSCWKASPKNRPTFTDLCKLLEDLLENVSHYLRLENTDPLVNCDDANKSNSNQSCQSLCPSGRYLQPDFR